MRTDDLHPQVIAIAQDYLGPAAERFIDRMISYHLHKEPNELQKADIPILSEWVKVSLSLLTDDKKVVNDCERRILKLAGL